MNITKKQKLEISISLDTLEDIQLFFNAFDHPLVQQALGYTISTGLRPSVGEGYDIKSQTQFNEGFDSVILQYADNLKTLKESNINED
jgi:hypothetical protein